jgi:acetylornithine deacetylase/succinyl-diaminopimelate desuccinylase-like protein
MSEKMLERDAAALDARVAELSEKYLPLAQEILQEAIRIPADYVDRAPEDGGDPECGLSNHEGPRLEYLRRKIVEIGAVRSAEDVGFDEYGNLVWVVQDPGDGVAPAEKRVVYFDGHSDTVRALREQWREKIGGGIDAYEGRVDGGKVDQAFLERELGYLPPREEWGELIWGRGSADQLGGVVAEILATKIALELAPMGALQGVIVRCYATAAEEDNDGAGPMYVMQKVLPGAGPELIPDVVVLTEGTGDAQKGALGIYRGQRGRMQIEVAVTGRSCHGSMPWEGLNPLEFGAAILVEAAERYARLEGFRDDPFLGHGTRTASWAELETPSDCAVPDIFRFRFDRRLTVGESPEAAVADVEGLAAVARAREAGLQVEVQVPHYEQLTWRGYRPGNPQTYLGWATPESHVAVQSAAAVYRAVISPHVTEGGGEAADSAAKAAGAGGAPGAGGGATIRSEPRVERWIFSTDGVGYPVRVADSGINVPARKAWVKSGEYHHPPMFGLGPGIEQNTHKIGECVDRRELRHAISFLARYPSAFASAA